MEQRFFNDGRSMEMLAREQKDGMHEFLCAVRGDEVLGYVGMMYVLDEGYISNIAVREDARRQGIADALLSTLWQRAEELSLAFLTLEVRESNLGAIALYEKNGYARVGLRKNYYEQPKENAVLMTKFRN